jgi:enoyl-CoA hydratase/carnithine racemase
MPKHTTELLLLGKRVDVAEALRMGLANQVVPAGSVMWEAE